MVSGSLRRVSQCQNPTLHAMMTTTIQLLLTQMHNLITLPGRAAPLSKTNARALSRFALRPAPSRAAPRSRTNAGSRFAEPEGPNGPRRLRRIPWARGAALWDITDKRAAGKLHARNRAPERAAGATKNAPATFFVCSPGFTEGKERKSTAA